MPVPVYIPSATRRAALHKANLARKAGTDAYAAGAVAVLDRVYPRDQTTAARMARQMMDRCVPTPRGKRIWHRSQVERLMRRAGVWKW